MINLISKILEEKHLNYIKKRLSSHSPSKGRVLSSVKDNLVSDEWFEELLSNDLDYILNLLKELRSYKDELINLRINDPYLQNEDLAEVQIIEDSYNQDELILTLKIVFLEDLIAL
jgi:hypothetical protein